MPNQIHFLTVAYVLSAGCTKQAPPDNLETASGYVDVTVNGKRFYGLHLEFVPKGQELPSNASSVIVVPWDAHPKFSVALHGDVSLVAINGEEYRIEGRRVCQTDGLGTALTLYPGRIPLQAYTNRLTLQSAVANIMEGAEHRAANRSQPIRLGTNQTSESAGSGR